MRESARHGHSSTFSSASSQTFSFPIPSQMLAEITSYHLNANSFAIFSETFSEPSVIRQVNSATQIPGRPRGNSSYSQQPPQHRHRSVNNNNDGNRNHSTATISRRQDGGNLSTNATRQKHPSLPSSSSSSSSSEILPLLLVMWDEPSSIPHPLMGEGNTVDSDVKNG